MSLEEAEGPGAGGRGRGELVGGGCAGPMGWNGDWIHCGIFAEDDAIAELETAARGGRDAIAGDEDAGEVDGVGGGDLDGGG